MRRDDSLAGCHVVIWTPFACTQNFRLHFHHTQLPQVSFSPTFFIHLKTFLLWSDDICYGNYKIRHTMIKLRKKKKKREKYFLMLFCHSRNLRGYMVWLIKLNSLYSKILKQKLKRKQTKKTKPLFYLTWIAYCKKNDTENEFLCFLRVSWFSFFTECEMVR